MEYDYEGQRVGLARAAKSISVQVDTSSELTWWGWLMACVLMICTIAFFYMLFRLFKPNRKRKIRQTPSNEGQMLQSLDPRPVLSS